MSTEPNVPAVPPATAEDGNGLASLPPELYPNIDHLVIEDDEPVESVFAEKQMRLLTEPLYASWQKPGEGRTFEVFANVGLFSTPRAPALVPDVMLATDVPTTSDLSRKENNTYLIWEYGKPPDVVIEFVSDRRGGEEGHKFRQYARIRVPYYVIFDPTDRLGHGVLRSFGLAEGVYQPLREHRFPLVGLVLRLWQGDFEGRTRDWLRWCDLQGNLIPTGQERADKERQRADEERQRADEERQMRERLEAQLRAHGIEPQT